MTPSWSWSLVTVALGIAFYVALRYVEYLGRGGKR